MCGRISMPSAVAYATEEHRLVESGGVPVAAISSIDDDDRLRGLTAQELLRELGPGLSAESARQGMVRDTTEAVARN